mmetsp:Transcript_6733/g.16430  ORF Transcript_6733/g.16430 Transcript_6733/m.16430 type:complete len:86 (-) Transcript_6733:79-336(-)
MATGIRRPCLLSMWLVAKLNSPVAAVHFQQVITPGSSITLTTSASSWMMLLWCHVICWSSSRASRASRGLLQAGLCELWGDAGTR